MKKISVVSLVPHSFFTTPVYLDEGYIILSPDIPVTTELINRLRTWNFSQIFCDGESIIEQQDTLVAKSISQEGILDRTIQEQEKNQRIMTFYFDLIQYLDSFLKNYIKKNELILTEIIDRVKKIININRSKILLRN